MGERQPENVAGGADNGASPAPRSRPRLRVAPGRRYPDRCSTTTAVPTPDPVPTAAPAWIAQRVPRRPRAILADTDGMTLVVMGHRLERAGFDVEVHRTGPAALEAALAAPPAVVVAAARLPGLDGTGLFEGLAVGLAEPPPVVLLFWPGNAEAVAAALDMGVADAVVRPISLVETVARIRRSADV